jgi:peptidoglycan hydrolase-like protein with peptidoglycan-binding domain
MANYNSNKAVVKQTQRAINLEGYSPPLIVDGTYGAGTAAGVRWFQGRHGLAQDGIIGDLTVAATIAHPPGVAHAATGTLASLQAQITRLRGQVTPAASASLVPPVRSLLVSAALPNLPVGVATSLPDMVEALAKSPNGPLVMTGAGGVLGAVIGALFGGPIWIIGAAAGAASGYGASKMIASMPAAAPAGDATMHGESGDFDADFDFEMDSIDIDDGRYVAAELGMPALSGSVKA